MLNEFPFLLLLQIRDPIGVTMTGRSATKTTLLQEKPMKLCSECLFYNRPVRDSKTLQKLFAKELKSTTIILSQREKK